MQYDNSDDPWGFWEAEPTRQLQRTNGATRAANRVHGETTVVPVVRAARPATLERRRRPNPLTARLGLLAAAMVLVVPVALSLRTDDRRVLRPADAAQAATPLSVAKSPPPAPSIVTVAPTTVPTTTLATTTLAPVTAPPTGAVVETAPPTEPPTTLAAKRRRLPPNRRARPKRRQLPHSPLPRRHARRPTPSPRATPGRASLLAPR